MHQLAFSAVLYRFFISSLRTLGAEQACARAGVWNRFVISSTSGAEYICTLSSPTARLTKARPAQTVTVFRSVSPCFENLVLQVSQIEYRKGSQILLSQLYISFARFARLRRYRDKFCKVSQFPVSQEFAKLRRKSLNRFFVSQVSEFATWQGFATGSLLIVT